MPPCDYCAKEAIRSFRIEESRLGKAIRDDDGISLGRQVISPSIYAHACPDHVEQVQRAIDKTAKRKAVAKREAAERARQRRQ